MKDEGLIRWMEERLEKRKNKLEEETYEFTKGAVGKYKRGEVLTETEASMIDAAKVVKILEGELI